MKNSTQSNIIKRIAIITSIITIFIILFNIILLRYKINERKTTLILESLNTHKILISELHTLFYGVQNDFKYFELKIKNALKYPTNHHKFVDEVNSQIDFLNTHPDYFKIRIVNLEGKEIYKIIQNADHSNYKLSDQLHNLKGQAFYKDLTVASKNGYYFSSMDANIIDGQVEYPIRPTIRAAKKTKLFNNEMGLIVFNIDGNRILNLFDSNVLTVKTPITMSLIDQSGHYIASYPVKKVTEYIKKESQLKDLAKKLQDQKISASHIRLENEIIVFSYVNFPMSHEKWILITHIPKKMWINEINKDWVAGLILEGFFIFFIILWLWREEKNAIKMKSFKFS